MTSEDTGTGEIVTSGSSDTAPRDANGGFANGGFIGRITSDSPAWVTVTTTYGASSTSYYLTGGTGGNDTVNFRNFRALVGGRVQRDIGPLDPGEKEKLRRCLAGELKTSDIDDPWDPKLIYHPHARRRPDNTFDLRGWSVSTSHGGYLLLTRDRPDKPWQLGLDIGDMVDTARLNEYRSFVLDTADELGVPVMPVGQTAYTLGPYALTKGGGEVRLVHRQGFECVFTMTRANGRTLGFLSGYDTQESPPLYFICRLPHEVGTVDEARESLMPASVRLALEKGKKVVRQGDLFAIESEVKARDIKKAGGSIHADLAPAWRGVPGSTDMSLYGTAHTASKVARLPTGQELAIGRLIHDPRVVGEGRPPDHTPRKLSRKWWWIIPNTVPKS